MLLKKNLLELRKSSAEGLIDSSKQIHAEYRKSTEIVNDIYEWATEILNDVFQGQNYTLPIDVRKVASVLGFTISVEDFTEVESQYFENGHNSLPIAQLKMRQKQFGKDSDIICGTIHLSNYLSEYSIRFSIAHELGHFALREHNPIGSSLVLEACPGLYPMVETEEMLADIFAYALLLPRHLFEQEREEYERDRTHWPLDYSEWIEYIRDKAQMPEYYAVLACQEIKKCSIYDLECVSAEGYLNERLRSFDIIKSNDQRIARLLCAITINNLESWGFSREQVATILFDETNDTTIERKAENHRIIVNMRDLFLNSDELKRWKKRRYTENEYQLPYNDSDAFDKLKAVIINNLRDFTDMSVEGISDIMAIPVDKVKLLLDTP